VSLRLCQGKTKHTKKISFDIDQEGHTGNSKVQAVLIKYLRGTNMVTEEMLLLLLEFDPAFLGNLKTHNLRQVEDLSQRKRTHEAAAQKRTKTPHKWYTLR
jgi:hypothetical protein